MLNLKKYDSNCHCYAIIERLKMKPITMVDLLYSYQEISLDNPMVRDNFMKNFTRKNINLTNMKSPGTMFIPSSREEKKLFVEAMKKSVEENVGRKIFIASRDKTEKVEIKKYPDPNKVVPDEAISGEKVLRPTDPVITNVNYSIVKDLIFMKNGAIITGSEQSGKYWTNYRTQTFTDKNVDEIETGTLKDMMSVYITGVDDNMMMKNPEYFKKFEKTILSSHMLEALSYVNQAKLPVFAYCGEFNKNDERMMENLSVEKYIEQMNKALFLNRSQESVNYR